jgi:uncharacterized protein YigA (DUF484 family)
MQNHQGRKANSNSDVTMIKKIEDQTTTEASLAQPTEEQVIAFLRKNPEFFASNEYLLSELKIPHASGAAISLGERQVQVFREHRDELKYKLNELISVARENDAHFEKSKRLLLNLLEVKSLDEIEMVVNEVFKNDLKIDFSSIILFGKSSDYPASDIKIIELAYAKQHLGAILDQTHASCGRFSEKQLKCLFPNDAEKVGSVAVIPLRHGDLLGLFCLGSEDPAHFDSSMGSLFLSYISDFISRILPNLLLSSKQQYRNDNIPSLLE